METMMTMIFIRSRAGTEARRSESTHTKKERRSQFWILALPPEDCVQVEGIIRTINPTYPEDCGYRQGWSFSIAVAS